jgi:hypothetical protein
MSKVEKECDNQSRSWGDKPPAQTVSELWKMGKAGTNSPLESLKRILPAETLILVPKTHFGLQTFRSIR